MSGSDFEDAKHQYDQIAQQYRDAKALPYKEHILTHSLFSMIGKLEGK
ncbi:hypothetical protein [Hoeflea sp. TYP-13]